MIAPKDCSLNRVLSAPTMTSNLSPSQRFDPLSHGVTSGFSDIYEAQLGPAPRAAAPNPHAGKSYSRVNMLAEYEGKNYVVRDTMEDYMLTAEYDFLTKFILPYFRTDQIHLTWSEWQNNPHYMGPTPHQATSRVITKKRIIRKASVVRRGLAYQFEDDHIGTPGGRSSWWASVAALARAFQETANVEVLRALRHCHVYDQQQVREYELVPAGDLDAWLERASERFMIVQKSDTGMGTINTLIDQEQEQIGGAANAWIVGREIMDYISTSVPTMIQYKYGGQEAVDRLNGVTRTTAAAGTMGNVKYVGPQRMVGDAVVFLAKSNLVEGIGKADLLSRTTEVGIYNLMADRTRDYSKYRKEGRDLKVYNNTTDAWSVIQFQHAIENLGVWDKNGVLTNVFGQAYARSANKGVPGSSVMDEMDFLSFINPAAANARQNIEFFGDMSANWITAQHFLNAGQTVVNAMGYQNPARIEALTAEYDAAAAGAGGAQAFSNIAKRAQDLLGKDNVFFDAAANPAATFFSNIVTAGMSAVAPQRLGAAAVGAGVDQETGHQKWIRGVFGPVFTTDGDKAEVNAIAGDSSLTWQTRAARIKDIVLDRVRNEPDAVVTQLGDSAQVDDWYNTRVRNYKNTLEKQAPVASAAADVGGEVQYVHSDRPVAENMPALRATGNKAPARVGARHVQQAPGARGAFSEEEQRQFRANERPATRAGFNQRYRNMAVHLQAIHDSSAQGIVKAMAMLYCGVSFTKQRLVSLHNAHVAVLLNIMLARPHCTYKTRMGIKVATNGAAGFTVFGHSDMQYGNDPGAKVGFLHYTAYLSAVVTDPKNVAVVPDIYCQRYLGGMGVDFWTPESYRKTNARRSRSIIAYPLPPTVMELEKRIDARGRWYTLQKLGFCTAQRFDRPLFPGAARMNLLFDMHNPMRTDRSHSGGGRTPANYTLAQGMEWYFNTHTQQWDDYTVEQSPFGQKVYPGCGKVRNGQLKFLKDPNYSMIV